MAAILFLIYFQFYFVSFKGGGSVRASGCGCVWQCVCDPHKRSENANGNSWWWATDKQSSCAPESIHWLKLARHSLGLMYASFDQAKNRDPVQLLLPSRPYRSALIHRVIRLSSVPNALSAHIQLLWGRNQAMSQSIVLSLPTHIRINSQLLLGG